MEDEAFVIMMVMSPITLSLASFGNIVTLILLYRLRFHNRAFVVFLNSLAVSDLLQLYLVLLPSWLVVCFDVKLYDEETWEDCTGAAVNWHSNAVSDLLQLYLVLLPSWLVLCFDVKLYDDDGLMAYKNFVVRFALPFLVLFVSNTLLVQYMWGRFKMKIEDGIEVRMVSGIFDMAHELVESAGENVTTHEHENELKQVFHNRAFMVLLNSLAVSDLLQLYIVLLPAWLVVCFDVKLYDDNSLRHYIRVRQPAKVPTTYSTTGTASVSFNRSVSDLLQVYLVLLPSWLVVCFDVKVYDDNRLFHNRAYMVLLNSLAVSDLLQLYLVLLPAWLVVCFDVKLYDDNSLGNFLHVRVVDAN
nr:hypothetical protein BaRGS_005563 [Batillaria attramentaria]